MNAEFLGESLIFLISQPRAGSSLLQRILAGHPTIQTAAEPWLMLHPVYALRQMGLEAEYSAQQAYNALQDFLVHYADGEATYDRAVRAWASVLYGRALAGTGSEFFLDKTPRYYFIIPELHRIFPEAKFVFLIRNPLAVLSSIITTWVKDCWTHFSIYRNDLLLAPRRILEAVELLGDDAIVVYYEELVTAPVDVVSLLCQRLNISFDVGMLHYGDKPIPDGRMGDAVGIWKYSSPSTDSLDKWISLGNAKQTRHLALAYLDELGADVIEKLGYSFQKLRGAIEETRREANMPCVPWHIAIRPFELWTLRERLIAKRAMAIQREGTLRGTVLFVVGGIHSLIRCVCQPDHS